MITTQLTAAAANLSRQIHSGEIARTGAPAFEHYFTVASSFDTEEEVCAALLCDALGKGKLSLSTLREMHFPESVIDAVELLTYEEPEDYFDYIGRVMQNDLAARVRRADLAQRIIDMNSYVSLTGMDRRRRTTCQKAIDLIDGTDKLWFDGTFASQHGKTQPPAPPHAPHRADASPANKD